MATAPPRRLRAAAARRWRATCDRNGGVAVVIALALVVIAGFLWRADMALNQGAWGGHDSRGYRILAAGLFETGTYDDSVAPYASKYAPGTPLLHAAVYGVLGRVDPGAGRVVVAFLGAVAILLTYLIARRLAAPFGRRRAGPVAALAAASALAFSPGIVGFYRYTMSEPVALFLVTAAVLAFLWAWDGRTPWRYLLPGALVGAAALTRAEYLLVAVPFAALAGVRIGRAGSWKAGLAAAAGVVAACAVIVAPWTVCNYVQLGRFVPITTGGGTMLYIGTNLAGGGESLRTREFLLDKYSDLRTVRLKGRPATASGLKSRMEMALEREASRYPALEQDEALSKIARANLVWSLRNRPLDYLWMTATKVWRMWNIPASRPYQRLEWMARSPAYTRTARRVVLLLALAGIVSLAVRRRSELLVVVTPLVVVTATALLMAAPARRSMPLLGVTYSLAAVGALACALLVGHLARIAFSGRQRSRSA